MKVAVVFILLLVVILPTLPMTASGDGTLKGRVQSFLNYSLFITWVLLGMLTVCMACSTLASELRNRQIYSLATKPVSRWRILFGKWLGVTVLNAALLAAVGLTVLACVYYLRSQPGLNYDDKMAVEHEILTARVSLRPKPPDFAAEVEARYEELEAKGNLPKTVMEGGAVADATKEKVLASLRADMVERWRHIRPFEGREFVFENVRVDRAKGGVLFLRFKIWPRPIPPGETYKPLFALGDPKYKVWPIELPAMSVRQFHTVPVPASVVSPDKTLLLRFFNDITIQPTGFEGSVSFEGDDGLEVLYRIGSFEGNLLRALTMILLSLMFFAALGLAASTFLSFPVAVLLLVMVFAAESWAGPLAYVLYPVSYMFVQAVPDLSTYNPIETLADGRNVSLMWVWLCFRNLILIRGTIVSILAAWLFHRRELAEVIV
jgi:ABC-type transport system involved in multi-copper enzyme maturation permease subunit